MDNFLTFAGLPALGVPTEGIAVVGAPHGVSYRPGEPSHSVNAPGAIRRAAQKYADMVSHYDFDLGGPLLSNGRVRAFDARDVSGMPDDPAGNQIRITEKIRALLAVGAVPLLLGGDDSIPIPFFRAYDNMGPLTVIQVDAHIDWRDEINGISEGPSSTMRRASEMPWIDTLIQVGIRGVGSAGTEDVQAARAYGAHIVTARTVLEKGPGCVLDLVPEGAACLISLDCDGLDPAIMPAVKAPSPGGLSYWNVVDLIHGVARKGRIQGFDMVEFVPEKDPDGLAALTAARIIMNTIGALVRSWMNTT